MGLSRMRVVTERETDGTVVRVAVLGVQENPLAHQTNLSLEPFRQDGEALGREMAAVAVAALAPNPVAGFGKSATVGAGGQIEHALGRMVTPFVEAMKQVIGPTKTWSSTSGKRSEAPIMDLLITSTQDLADTALESTFSVPLGEPLAPEAITVGIAFAKPHQSHRGG